MRTPTLAILLLSSILPPLVGQVPRTERRKWLDPKTTVTDDPRRIPIPAGYNAPTGTIVLKGGRLWDGTGATARTATLVITRNHITAILSTTATDWP